MIDVPLVFRKPVKTITDAKDIAIYCSMCDTHLINIVITHETNVVWHVRANCPYCGDKSYVTAITGEIRYMPSEKTKLYDICTDKQTSDGKDLLEIIVVKND